MHNYSRKMNDLPIEIHEKIIRYASWDLFCAFVFASKKHYKICKSIDLRKYTKLFRTAYYQVRVLPNYVFHGKYIFSADPPNNIYVSVEAEYAYGRLHGTCIHDKNTYSEKRSKFVRGHLYYGIPLCKTLYELYHYSPIIKNKSEFKNSPPHGSIRRVSPYELYCYQDLNKDVAPINILGFFKMLMHSCGCTE